MDNIALDKNKLPKHLAIIMDGNGRWAKEKGLPRTAGHKQGVQTVIDVVEDCAELGIEYLSLFAFSTENWKRPKKEVENLMKLLVQFIDKELGRLHKNNIKVRTMGDISQLPSKVQKKVEKAINTTKDNNRMVLNIGLNYGGRDDILEASKKIGQDLLEGKLSLEKLDEDLFKDYLYTSDIPDVDLLIRPSGEQRISNFMLYQIAYAELWFSNIYWPDFNKEDLYRALEDYENRDRRFGGVKDE